MMMCDALDTDMMSTKSSAVKPSVMEKHEMLMKTCKTDNSALSQMGMNMSNTIEYEVEEDQEVTPPQQSSASQVLAENNQELSKSVTESMSNLVIKSNDQIQGQRQGQGQEWKESSTEQPDEREGRRHMTADLAVKEPIDATILSDEKTSSDKQTEVNHTDESEPSHVIPHTLSDTHNDTVSVEKAASAAEAAVGSLSPDTVPPEGSSGDTSVVRKPAPSLSLQVPVAVSLPLPVPRQRLTATDVIRVTADAMHDSTAHPLSLLPSSSDNAKKALSQSVSSPTSPLAGPPGSFPSSEGMKTQPSVSGSGPSTKTGTASGGPSYTTNERHMLSQAKSHVKHRFQDVQVDEFGKKTVICKFACHTFYATQFQALRASYLGNDDDEGYVRSLSMSSRWNTQGGKSGATFSRTQDGRLVIKHFSHTELQMFLDFAPAYFEYMTKALYHRLPSLLCKILGVYQVGYQNKVTGKKVLEQVVVMENLFYERNISLVFDLKGSSRRAPVHLSEPILDFDEALLRRRAERKRKRVQESGRIIGVKESFIRPYSESLPEYAEDSERGSELLGPVEPSLGPIGIAFPLPNGRHGSISEGTPSDLPVMDKSHLVLMDDNLMTLTQGMPFPLKHKAKVFFQKAVLNDTLFLSIINVVDYSIIVGMDDETHEVVFGIIDYIRQYDMVKRMESMGKSVGMMVGKDEPTVIPPLHYRKRFQTAMERYFMTVPDKW